MIVECPNCKKPLEWSSQNPHRPFCTERCKLIDLGAWADGSYAFHDDEPLDPNDLYIAEDDDE